MFQKDGHWALRKAGGGVRLYSTQKEAIEAGRRMVRKAALGQLVVLRSTGTYRTFDRHGLPIRQRSRLKSTLGRKAIQGAVHAAILERLLSE